MIAFQVCVNSANGRTLTRTWRLTDTAADVSQRALREATDFMTWQFTPYPVKMGGDKIVDTAACVVWRLIPFVTYDSETIVQEPPFILILSFST